MWLTEKLTAQKIGIKSSSGTVTSSQEKEPVISCNEILKTPLYAPYGVSYVPQKGAQVLLVPFADGYACAGVICEPKPIKEGELCLFSSGGAKIHLKANGDIILNGIKIDKYGNMTALSVREGVTAE